MTDPTLKSAGINTPEHPQWGVVVDVRIDGGLHGVMALPERLHTEEEVTKFVLRMNTLMSNPNGDPNTWTEEEQSFAKSLFDLAEGLVQQGLIWRVLNVLPPQQLRDAVAAYRRSLV